MTDEVKKPDPTKPVLSLDTAEQPRATVVIKTDKDREGKMYELAAMEDLSLQMQQKVAARGGEFQKLWDKDELSDGQQKRLEQIADEMTQVVIRDLPDEVFVQLRDWDKVRLIEAFTKAAKLTPDTGLVSAAATESSQES